MIGFPASSEECVENTLLDHEITINFSLLISIFKSYFIKAIDRIFCRFPGIIIPLGMLGEHSRGFKPCFCVVLLLLSKIFSLRDLVHHLSGLRQSGICRYSDWTQESGGKSQVGWQGSLFYSLF